MVNAENTAKISDAAKARAFILAGDARFTFVSAKTGVRYTYRVAKPEDKSPHFVKVLTGADNDSSYTFLGTIFDAASYRHGRRSRISESASSAKAFAWAWQNISRGSIPESLEVWHEGRCAKCGRCLTDPESIASGFGPVCRAA